MPYHLYTSPSFVLGSKPRGESGRLLTLFTERFGLILAVASGLRLEKSKLRYSLEPLSLVEVSLVRGKETWRVVGSESLDSFSLKYVSREKKELTARIFSLLRRLIHGEEESRELFFDLRLAFQLLNLLDNDQKVLASWESLLVLRLLKHLGYLKEVPVFGPFVAASEWSEELVMAFQPLESQAIKTINYLLRRTHL